MMRYLLFLFLIMGCYTSRQAEKDLDKAQIYYPNIVAQKTAKWYPCGIIATSIDSSEIIGWGKTLDSISYIIKNDTINIVEVREKDCSDSILIKKYNDRLKIAMSSSRNIISSLQKLLSNKPTITKTIYIKDSAAIFELQNQLNIARQGRDDYQKKAERGLKIIIFLIIALALSLLYNFIRK